LSYAVANTWIRKSFSRIPPVELTLWCLAGTAAVLLPWAVAWPTVAEPPLGGWWTSVGAVAVLGIFGTGLATCLFTQLVQDQGPLFAAMVTNLVPVIAMGWGWLDAEAISVRQALSVAGVLAMVALVQYKAARPTATNVRRHHSPPAEETTPQT
jgi:drug/metabolite transporter (DMT)-like permease